MELSFFDMHCDTAYEMYKRKQDLISNELAISLGSLNSYKKRFLNFAIWSDKLLSDNEAFKNFEKIRRDLVLKLNAVKNDPNFNYIISVEDARLLAGDLSRLDYLHYSGVKILTLLWGGSSCIGGAHDTVEGLTDFGRSVVLRCFKLGIVPDVSHASSKSFCDIMELSQGKEPIIATHSDSYSVNPHSRNLTDEEFIQIKNSFGLVGICLCCDHLGVMRSSPNAVDKVVEHIEHYMSLGGENTVCFGCDFDGADTPDILREPNSLILVAERLARLNYTQEMINKLYSKNAESFANKYLNTKKHKKGKNNEILQHKRY